MGMPDQTIMEPIRGSAKQWACPIRPSWNRDHHETIPFDPTRTLPSRFENDQSDMVPTNIIKTKKERHGFRERNIAEGRHTACRQTSVKKGNRSQELMGPWSPLSRHVFQIKLEETVVFPPNPSLKLIAARGMLNAMLSLIVFWHDLACSKRTEWRQIQFKWKLTTQNSTSGCIRISSSSSSSSS